MTGELESIWKAVVVVRDTRGMLLKPSIKESRFAGQESNVTLPEYM